MDSGDVRSLIHFLAHSGGHMGKVRTLHNVRGAERLLQARHHQQRSQRVRRLIVVSLGFRVIDVLNARLTVIEHFRLEGF